MFKILLVVCLSGLVVDDSWAQSGFWGSVKSDKGDNAGFAVVSIHAPSKIYTCDSIGNFHILDLPAGRYAISVKCVGYTTLKKNITIPGTETFYLSPGESTLDQVVVTAVAGSAKIKRTPVAIAVVTQKEMNRNSSTNMIDALLKAVPGISAVTTGPNISKPFIRGLGYNRVLTMYDGIRQEGQQWGDEHGIEVDQYGVHRAEVVKGPASLSYGSDAIAGVVNLIPFQPVLNDGIVHGETVTEYQSNNALIAGSAAFYYKKNMFSWSVRSSAKKAASYRNAMDGYVYNTGFSEWNVSAMVGWERAHAKDQLHFTRYNNLQEIPDGSRDSLTRLFTYQTLENTTDDIRNRPLVPENLLHTYRISPLHQHIQHLRIYHKGKYDIAHGELITTIGFQQNIRREYNHPTNASQAGLYVRLNTINYDVNYHFPEWNALRFTYGINGMYQQNKSIDATDFPIPDYQLLDIGHYLMAKKELTKWVISGGIRMDKRYIHWSDMYTRRDRASGFAKQVYLPDTVSSQHNFSAFSQNFTGISASIGAVYNASSNITVKANIARGYRSPNITEMGSNGLDPGAHIYYIGNKTFSPEYNWQEDIGVFAAYPDIDISIELFNNNINRYIFLQKIFDANGQPLELVPGNFTYAYQQGRARLYGFETSLTLHPSFLPSVQWHSSLSSITGINTDEESVRLLGADAKYLPLIPPLKTMNRLQWKMVTDYKRLSDGYLFAELETYAVQNKFYGVDDTETATKAYSLVHIGAGASFHNKSGKPFCRIVMNINNLFDVAYQSHLNRLKYFEYYSVANGVAGIYNMGRTMGVKLLFNW